LKVILLNGSPREKGCTYTALSEVAAQLEKNGIETEIVHVNKGPVLGCTACGACYKLGKCAYGDEDGVNECVEKIKAADGLVLGSPVHYASAAGAFVAFLDRVFYSKGNAFEGKLGAAVVSCRRGGATAAFDQLNKYFTISSMPIVASKYWNMVHGNKPEEVRQDLEGMQTMRVLGDNMAWLLKCIEAGRAAGIELPEREKNVRTNFIR
jgi:multimeric flavodoxin WrbA